MAILHIQKRDNPYVMIDKRPLDNSEMSWQAKGLLCYLLSKPESWNVCVEDLINRSKNGKDAVYSILKELFDLGHIVKRALREKGRFVKWEYDVFEEPQTISEKTTSGKTRNGKTRRGKTSSGKTTSGKTATSNNESSNNEVPTIRKDITSKNEESNNENTAAAASGFSPSLPDGSSLETEEEKEKGSAQKEKEASIRVYYQRYKDTWWEFYKKQNNGEEPPFTWRHPGLWNGMKKIQQDLVAEFGDEERAYQEFVHILSGWQHPKNYHRHRLKPDAMHRNLVEIRGILREPHQKVAEKLSAPTKIISQANEIFQAAHLEHKEIKASPHPKDEELLSKTLEYLRSAKEGNTWEDALRGFEFIVKGWPVLELHDKFYEENFTIRFIHGNTSKIISIFKSKQQKRSELTADGAAEWLARNGLN